MENTQTTKIIHRLVVIFLNFIFANVQSAVVASNAFVRQMLYTALTTHYKNVSFETFIIQEHLQFSYRVFFSHIFFNIKITEAFTLPL